MTLHLKIVEKLSWNISAIILKKYTFLKNKYLKKMTYYLKTNLSQGQGFVSLFWDTKSTFWVAKSLFWEISTYQVIIMRQLIVFSNCEWASVQLTFWPKTTAVYMSFFPLFDIYFLLSCQKWRGAREGSTGGARGRERPGWQRGGKGRLTERQTGWSSEITRPCVWRPAKDGGETRRETTTTATKGNPAN